MYYKFNLEMKYSDVNILFKISILILISAVITISAKAQDASQDILKMLPEIPAEIKEPAKRAEFLTTHFWDKFNFSDIDFLMKDQLLERCFVDFIDLLSIVPDETRDKSIDILMKKAENEPKIFSNFLILSEHYLYESGSPLFDEEKLIPFLKYALQSSVLSDTEKIRPGFLLENISVNRLGHVANDINYTLKTGETGTLHSINADHTILYFNDPECEDCAMLIRQLIASATITDLIKEGKLKIITVYLSDDIETWKKHSSEVPDTWIYTRDTNQKIIIDGIYNIKLFPTMYLLDKEKKVLLKETTFDNLENYFKES